MKDVKRGKVDLERGRVKEILDGFGEVLWAHLEEEVTMLGAVSIDACTSFGCLKKSEDFLLFSQARAVEWYQN